jgi:RNA polymerase sigma factor (TIGR02999 family)
VFNGTPDVTRLLNAFRDGDEAARDRLVEFLYPELRRLAAKSLNRKARGATWQPTALIHELYLRLVERSQPEWQSRAHFFAVAATIMRNILVDHARKRAAAKRGSGAEQVTLEEIEQWSGQRPRALLALDNALDALHEFDPRRARVLELRFFGGLTTAEIAEALGVSTATVGREMRMAEAWLARELAGTPSEK